MYESGYEFKLLWVLKCVYGIMLVVGFKFGLLLLIVRPVKIGGI